MCLHLCLIAIIIFTVVGFVFIETSEVCTLFMQIQENDSASKFKI